MVNLKLHGEAKISVCMATRNGARFICRQLESILAQLAPDDEVVISDDSSTDDTIAIIRSFADPRIRLLENNTFYSPIFNIENALQQARGDIIVLSDQDDIWLDNRISVVKERFRQKRAPVYLMALDGSVIDEHDNVTVESIFAKIKAAPGLTKNIYNNTYMGCCLAFSRELLEIALPFPRLIPMHDMWLGLLAEIFGKVEFVPEKTILYRKHTASLTDFRIQFLPISQIKRRWFLAYNLAKRWMELKNLKQ